ncbi:hypothetical protein IWT30_00646 [Secundilactobacillus mixtipabuli]|uniref:Uncharacterized protein n=1 Tax=Secundilactobacillus mixtipabuli TaxID=1435342 RepID=A0A1Z5IAP3_9LACO|nr:hypothetical protein IWT30_00646 [Secundilactobacillus mixtipabuli]
MFHVEQFLYLLLISAQLLIIRQPAIILKIEKIPHHFWYRIWLLILLESSIMHY